jgi:hypothetical protein
MTVTIGSTVHEDLWLHPVEALVVNRVAAGGSGCARHQKCGVGYAAPVGPFRFGMKPQVEAPHGSYTMHR